MIEEISDNKLLFAFRRLLDSSTAADRHMFRSTYYCGSKVITQTGLEPTVYVVKNDKSAKFVGVATCKSSWLCPVCSARMMAKYASNIAAALDALKSASVPQLAVMFTFTIPHTRGMTAYETTEILYNTWKDFIVHGNKTRKANAEKGRAKRWQMYDPFALFCESFGCKHRVRVGEYTYGEHGWHPHFHCLFWVDANKFEHVKAWEDTLNRRWLALAKKHTLKMWNQLYPINMKNNKVRLEIMYNNLNEGSKGCYLSKDENGKTIVQKSSQYICGWGADKELTGNVQNKASQEGHVTPRQLLEQYSQGDKKSGELYLEYCRATRRKMHCRINFSKGLKDVIAKYKLTNEYAEVLKKKATDEARANGIWREVCWFNNHEWNEICLAEMTTKMPIRFLILQAAMNDRGKEFIEDFLLTTFNIDVRKDGRRPFRSDIYGDTFKFVPAA